MRLRFLFIILFFALHSFALRSQDLPYARYIIDTLCSPYFAGRGYVENGYNKAAEFISEEFNRIGLRNPPHPFPYKQEFSMQVNTFPGRMSVKVDGKELVPGRDYLVEPASQGIQKKKYDIEFLDTNEFKKSPKAYVERLINDKKAFVYDLDKSGAFLSRNKKKNDANIFSLELGAAAYITLSEKLPSWDVSDLDKKRKQPFLSIRESAFPAGAKTIELDIENKEIEYTAQNVAGYIVGKTEPDSVILISAHLDHLGKMGSRTYFPGANDNASGIGMMLDLARYFAQSKNEPDYTLAFVAFGGEEAGLVGSKYFTEHPLVPLEKIAFMINLDLVANGQDGMMAVNGSLLPYHFHMLDSINKAGHYLKEIKARGKAANSDHYWFSEKGVKAFFFYLLGEYPYYHDIYDTPEKPTYAGYDGAFRLIKDFIVRISKYYY